MKLICCLLTFFIMSNVSAQSELTLEWDFFHPTRMEWMELGTHGSVQEALIATGELPDPYYGTNETKFGWLEEHIWKFKSIFVLTEDQFNNEYLELEFGNIDTYASISVNGEDVFKTKNAFIPHRRQVKDFLKVGVNEINVVITPPVIYHKETWDTASYHLPAPNDVHDIAIAPYTRKPQYQFGWDWALRMNTIGFNKPAKIFMYNNNRVVNKSTRIVSVSEDAAEVEFQVFLAVPKTEYYEWADDYILKTKVLATDGVLKRTITVNNPKLWWPLGQGEQHLYENNVILTTLDFSVDLYVDFTFGIKTSELIQETDEWGTSYYFKINGRKIFCKGGDYIPQDIFPARVTDDQVQSVVETMAVSNFNMVRVWGGGYYPDEIFFETCDSLGIMVWEDLMFACAMYPGDDAFIANISEEFNYQIPRIAGHASVVQFNGNNEVEVAWENWGFQIKYGLYGKSAKEIEASYDRVFKETAPTIISKYTDLPYIHTSPLSNWGKADFYNHGTQHYWGVWHGKDPIQDFGKKIGRFNSEYGFQSFPEFNTLKTFSVESQWELNSEVMKHHQKSYVGNDMILKHAKKLYGTPEDFGTFVYYSQLTQSMAVSMAIAGHRVDYPRCGGTLYWQVNDCWPAPTWSSLDYFGNWKALQYRVKDDYEEVAIVEKYDDLEKVDYWLVSGLVDTFECNLSAKFSDEKGKLLDELAWVKTVKGQQSFSLFTEEQLVKFEKKNIRIDLTWNDPSGQQFSRSFDRFREESKAADCKDVVFEILEHDKENGTMKVQISTKKYLRDFWLYSDVLGVQFDRNFISLAPGNHIFQLTSANLTEDTHFEMRWR